MFDTGGVVLPAAVSPLRELADRARPVVLARDNTIALGGPLSAVIPGGALVRGSTLTIAGPGATSVALGLVAGASVEGSWVAMVGLADLAPVAVIDAGLDPGRVAFIDPGTSGRHVDVIAALIGAIDIVMVDDRLPVRQGDARRLSARLRERGSIMVVLHPGTDPAGRRRDTGIAPVWSADVSLTVDAETWSGPDHGHGHLRSRRLSVATSGRGRAARGSRHVFAFPSTEGDVVEVDPGATVIPFAR